MVDPFRGMFEPIYALIEAEQYFLLHAPRQTGKTTFLHALAHRLNRTDRYTSVVFSVETAGVPSFTEEMAVGNGRTDLAVFWKQQVFAIEMKINRNARSEVEGLQQIARYLDKMGLQTGYLILFEQKSSEELPWEQRLGWEVLEQDGKQITLVKL